MPQPISIISTYADVESISEQNAIKQNQKNRVYAAAAAQFTFVLASNERGGERKGRAVEGVVCAITRETK